MDRKLKHLEFTQNVINRLSTNSFLLKGWSVVLVSALFVLSSRDSDQSFIFLAYIPSVAFWGLDGYFLWQERVYRELYNRIRTKGPDDIDFDMDTRNVGNDVSGWLSATLSKTLIPFHGVLLVAIVAVSVLRGI